MAGKNKAGRVLPPQKLLSDQKLADMVQTSRLGEPVTMVQSEALESLCHELLWHRGQHGAQVLALKVVGGAAEILLEQEPDGQAAFGDLLEGTLL